MSNVVDAEIPEVCKKCGQTTSKKWVKFLDLGFQNVLGKYYFVSQGPSGKLYFTDAEQAKASENVKTFRHNEDFLKMSEAEREETNRQANLLN